LPRIDGSDEENDSPRPLRQRLLIYTVLMLAATLVYAEMYFRFS